MAERVLFSFAAEILKKLGCNALEELAAAWGFRTRLNRLKDTIESLRSVLLDAEERQLESHAVRCWLRRLQDALYTADDLFDEFASVASKNEATERSFISTFLSSSNPIAIAFTVSHKIRCIREHLDSIVQDGHQFGFVLRPFEQPNQGIVIVRRSSGAQTYSFVDAEQVIGRDEDKKFILDMLLSSSDAGEHVSVVPIVGMGGLGKTTLAQLIYNDEMIEQHFELRLWVCVSENFDEKEIILKILTSAIKEVPRNLDIDQLQSQMRQAVGGRKYLLVLDDMWNEDREKWLKLSALLNTGKEGSKILVTTRSSTVARVMGTVSPHYLDWLSEEKSWALFQKMAFEPGQEDNSPPLVQAGKEIIKKCGNVPLAIRTLGSLLYGKDESKWLSFKNSENLAKISDDANNIMPVLKLSYNHLISPLKNCFAYCALFPKDYEFQKETLISLWMAEGFLIPTDGSGSQLEEVGEDYFFTLVHRSFFQDIRVDEGGNIKSCKIHDLLHDLAQEVAGVESKVAKLGDTNLDEKIRRLSLGYHLSSPQSVPSCVLNLKVVRTLLLPEQVEDGSFFSESICDKLISGFRCLRVLDLNNLSIEILPTSIGKLIQLRYLNLSHTRLLTLPSSIADLHNLQTLNLYCCQRLASLPKDIRKLINLRSLDVGGCSSLSHMPSGMGELTSLHKLNQFVVRNEYQSNSRCIGAQLRDLKNLNNLRGDLHIILKGELKDPILEAKEANLSGKHGLNKLSIENEPPARNFEQDEAILEGLKPHRNLKMLMIVRWSGRKLPSWAMMDNLCTCLPHLVDIQLEYLQNCWQLPSFGQLPLLKRLRLHMVMSVEFMDSSSFPHRVPLSAKGTPLFFPSLQVLELILMYGLKGWWKHGEENVVVGEDGEDKFQQETNPSLWMSFPNLSRLVIQDCAKLKSIPLCPNVKDLTLVKVNQTLSVLKMAASASSGSSLKLKSLCIDNVQDLISLPKECLIHLCSLEIRDGKLRSTSTLKQVFTSLPSLRSLQFNYCNSLQCSTTGLEHLTTLEQLTFAHCWELGEEDEDVMPWEALNKNLRHLELNNLIKLTDLPHGLQYLTNLRSLHIGGNDGCKLIRLPEWIACLSSLEFFKLERCNHLIDLPYGIRQLNNLNRLEIRNCNQLTERCRGPTSWDWHKIKHIPFVIIQD